MSGIIAVYGLVIAVLIAGDLGPESSYSLFSGFAHLGAGLSVGLAGLAAGYAIGIVGNAGTRAFLQQGRVFVGMVLILIFAEVLGLYGLIIAYVIPYELAVDGAWVGANGVYGNRLILNTKTNGG